MPRQLAPRYLLLSIITILVFCLSASAEDAKSLCTSAKSLYEAGKFTDAVDAYSKAVSLDPSYVPAYIGRAQSKRKLTPPDLQGSIEDLDIAISKDPKNSDAYNNRGISYFHLNEVEKARLDYNKAIELNPKSEKPYCNLGSIEFKNKNYKAAIALFDKSIALNSKFAIGYSSRARAKEELKDYSGAMEDFGKSIELDDRVSVVYNNRGVVKQKMGDLIGARGDYETAIKLDPNSELSKNNITKINKQITAKSEKSEAVNSSVVRKPDEESTNQSSQAVAVSYLEDKPDDTAIWNLPDTPWAKGDTPLSTVSSENLVSPELDFDKLDFDAYRTSVMNTMECLRLIYGELSDEENARFDAKWAPILDYPSPQSVTYFNNINPLLSRFLIIRSAISQTSLQFDQAWTAAGIAAGFGNQDDVAEAISQAYTYKTNLVDLKQQMDTLTQAIIAFGDPPNPLAARHRSRKIMEAALKSVVTLAINPGKLSIANGKTAQFTPVIPNAPKKMKIVWSFSDGGSLSTSTLAAVAHVYTKPGSFTVTMSVTDLTTAKPYGSATAKVTVGAPAQVPGARYVLIDWVARCKPYGDVIAYGNHITETMILHDTDKNGKEIETGSVTFNYSWNHPPSTFTTTKQFNMSTDMIMNGSSGKWSTEIEGFQPVMLFFKPDQKDMASKLVSGQNVSAYELSKTNWSQFLAQPSWVPGHDLFNQDQAGKYLPSNQTWTTQLSSKDGGIGYPIAIVKVNLKSFGVDAQSYYVYAYDPTGQKKPIDLDMKVAESDQNGDGKTQAQLAAEADQKSKADQIAVHKRNIEFYQGSLSQWRSDLQSASTPDRVKELNQRLVDAYTEISREKDLITSIQSGTLVHTRSMAEDVQHAQVIASCYEDLRKCKEIQDNAIRARNFEKAVESTRGLINMLSPEESGLMHEWANKHLGVETFAKHDTAKLKKIASAVLNKVQGQNLQSEAVAMDAINTLEEIKFGASTALIVVAPFATAEAVLSGSAIAAQTPSWVATGYGVGTGYIEGGVKQAVITGARFYSKPIDIAVSAMEGFNAEEGGGVKGALKNVAVTLLMRKGSELAANSIMRGRIQNATGAGRSWKDVVEDANFKQAKKDGEAVVDNYRRADEVFSKMVSAQKPKEMSTEAYLLANADNIAKTKEGLALKDAVAMVENSYTAKVAFNEATIPTALKQRYNITSELFLERPVVARTKELMQKNGWNDFEMHQIRHSANRNNVGHDRDLAVCEEGWIPTKNGKPMSMQEFQAELEHNLGSAFKEVSGKRSAKLSDWKGTTSVDPEAYLDRAVLDISRMRTQGIDPLTRLNPALAEQTAGVNVYKTNLALSKGTREGTAEACRTISKELNTKILPFMPRNSASFRYFDRIRTALDRGVTDPRGAELEVYGITGKRLPELSTSIAKRLTEIITGTR